LRIEVFTGVRFIRTIVGMRATPPKKRTKTSADYYTHAELAAMKRASKTKYTCPTCGANCWAKPGSAFWCDGPKHYENGDASHGAHLYEEDLMLENTDE
jgi:hypothetical protein